jgi:hypothetical protein
MEKHVTSISRQNIVLYHGTVEEYVPDIRKFGLKEVQAHTWKIHFDNDLFGKRLDPEETTEGVYLTSDRDHAEQYAQTKANYLHQKPGAEFMMYGSKFVLLKKDDNAPVLQTKPVLVTVTIPKGVKGTWDRDSEDGLAIRYFGVIEPEYITSIETLGVKYDPKPFDSRQAAEQKKKLMIAQLGEFAELFSKERDLDAGN